ncbi:MAG: hypothetical protein AB8B77_06485 [Alphaproteobacteria bacterium]
MQNPNNIPPNGTDPNGIDPSGINPSKSGTADKDDARASKTANMAPSTLREVADEIVDMRPKPAKATPQDNESDYLEDFRKRKITLNVAIGIIIALTGIFTFRYLGQIYYDSAYDAWVETASIESSRLTKYADYQFNELTYRVNLIGQIQELSTNMDDFKNRMQQNLRIAQYAAFDQVYVIPKWSHGQNPSQAQSIRQAVSLRDTDISKQGLKDLNDAGLWLFVSQARTRMGQTLVTPIYQNRQNEAKMAFILYISQGDISGALIVVADVSHFFEQYVVENIPDGLILRINYVNSKTGAAPINVSQDQDARFEAIGIERPLSNNVAEEHYILGLGDAPQNSLASFSYDIQHSGSIWQYNWDVLTSFNGGIDKIISQRIKFFGSLSAIMLGFILIYINSPTYKIRSIIDKETKDLRQEIDRLKRIFSSRTAAVFNMHQEMRSSIEVTMGYADMIHREVVNHTSSPKLQKYTDGLIHGSNTMRQMIAELISIISSERTHILQAAQPINILQLCSNLRSEMTQEFERKNISLAVEVNQNLPFIHADIWSLRRILQALINTAAKYTPPDGKIIIRSQYEFPAIQNEHQKRLGKKANISLEIIDDGLGLPIQQSFIDNSQLSGFSWNSNEPSSIINESAINFVLNLCHLVGVELYINTRPGVGTTQKLVFPDDMLAHNVTEGERVNASFNSELAISLSPEMVSFQDSSEHRPSIMPSATPVNDLNSPHAQFQKELNNIIEIQSSKVRKIKPKRLFKKRKIWP